MMDCNQMRALMLDALKQSIERWYGKLMLALAGELYPDDLGDISCQCCQTSYDLEIDCGRKGNSHCNYCILKIGGHCENQCDRSPYFGVQHMVFRGEDSPIIIVPLVIREIEFLEMAYQKELAK